MGLDQQGYFWLSDPLVAGSTIIVAVGLLLWCHLSLGAGESERTVAAPVRVRRTPPTSGPATAFVRGVNSRVAAERERRDANRRRVA